jgi:hypothetical protein
VSSEKHGTTAQPGDTEARHASGVVPVRGSNRPLPAARTPHGHHSYGEPRERMTIEHARQMTRLSGYDPLLGRLPQDLQDMAAALGPFIQEAHTVVCEGHLTRHRHVAPADQPGVRDGVGGRDRLRRDARRVVTREARDARDGGGVDRCGQAR